MDKIHFKAFDPLTQLTTIEVLWKSLIEKCPHPYYLSWQWVNIWILSLPKNSEVNLIIGFKEQLPVIGYFLGRDTKTRSKIFKFHQLAINQSLVPEIDIATYIEYNNLLIAPNIRLKFETILDSLPTPWDELRIIRYLPLNEPKFDIKQITNHKYKITVNKSPSYYVDLNMIRENKQKNYLALLSQNRRKQIRRSIKEFEKFGEIKIQLATNIEEALNILEELIILHRKRWSKRGHQGSFATDYFINFPKQLIEERFIHGEIQLYKLTAGEFTIGCAYNFVYKKRVYAFSGGYNYLPENYYLPGFVCDYLCILDNINKGHSIYDFLEGENSYKESLSTNTTYMEDIIIRKNNFRNKFLSIATFISLKLRHLLTRAESNKYEG